MNYLSSNIKILRNRNNKTQEELALEVGKGQTTIGNWENGVSEPNVNELITITNYFGVDLNTLVTTDLAKGNLIEKGSRPKIRQIGNLKGNVKGNLNSKNDSYATVGEEQISQLNEDGGIQETTNWLVLKELKAVRQDIDRMLKILQNNPDKAREG